MLNDESKEVSLAVPPSVCLSWQFTNSASALYQMQSFLYLSALGSFKEQGYGEYMYRNMGGFNHRLWVRGDRIAGWAWLRLKSKFKCFCWTNTTSYWHSMCNPLFEIEKKISWWTTKFDEDKIKQTTTKWANAGEIVNITNNNFSTTAIHVDAKKSW